MQMMWIGFKAKKGWTVRLVVVDVRYAKSVAGGGDGVAEWRDKIHETANIYKETVEGERVSEVSSLNQVETRPNFQ